MREKKRRVRGELTAILKGRLKRALLSSESLGPNNRKNSLASEPPDRPGKKSGNNAQNDSDHGFLLFLFFMSSPRIGAQPFRSFRCHSFGGFRVGEYPVPFQKSGGMSRTGLATQPR